MKNITVAFLGCLLAVFLVCACVNKGGIESYVPIKVVMVDGSPLLTMSKMAWENFEIRKGYDINYTLIFDSDALVASLLNKEPDFAIAPVNVAAMMNANGSGYRLAAVPIWGILHIVSNQNISSLDDLKGETLLVYGRSGVPGITIRALFELNNIKYVENQGTRFTVPADTVHIIYLAGASDVRDAVIAGRLDNMTVKFALFAEPVATAIAGTTANLPQGQFTAKISLQSEWAKKNNGAVFPQAALIFHERLLEKDTVLIKKFIAMTELSAMYAQYYPKEAGDLVVTLGSISIPGGNITESAVKAGRIPLNFARAPAAKDAVNTYLKIIYEDTPSLIGGSMPQDNFYYEPE
jgi:NitT/TauT family transport system substrate-binding protein